MAVRGPGVFCECRFLSYSRRCRRRASVQQVPAMCRGAEHVDPDAITAAGAAAGLAVHRHS